MASTTTAAKPPVSRRPRSGVKKPAEATYLWEGRDRGGKQVRGEMRASGEAIVQSTLRRQGIVVTKVRKQRYKRGRKITDRDITMFTRQLATMMKSGVPLLQSFDIVAKGTDNNSVAKLFVDIKGDVETGTSLSQAFRKYPLYFDSLFCNLVGAGEAAGILDDLLDRLATYKEKIEAIKGKIKSALFYPVAVLVVAFIVVAVIMLFVVPAFKQVFESFGADLPAPTLAVIAVSDVFTNYWYLIFGGIGGGIYFFLQAWRRSPKVQMAMDRLLLKMPIFGTVVEKATIARWLRTLSTMFAAGVPLVEALDSVGGASGNIVYLQATKKIQQEVSTGTSLTVAMQNSGVFPNMVLQMASIGEESGSLDSMLGKSADIYEREVDDAVESLSSLLEPLIMVVLGTLIGGLVVAMYLPIFKLGQVV
jgi:type IV pilus assembly protein PilC